MQLFLLFDDEYRSHCDSGGNDDNHNHDNNCRTALFARTARCFRCAFSSSSGCLLGGGLSRARCSGRRGCLLAAAVPLCINCYRSALCYLLREIERNRQGLILIPSGKSLALLLIGAYFLDSSAYLETEDWLGNSRVLDNKAYRLILCFPSFTSRMRSANIIRL